MRVRKGRKGLYYTNGILDDNYYNDCNANLFQLYFRYVILQLPYDFKQVINALKEALYAISWILLLPIIPLMYAIYRKHTVRTMNIKKEMFKKDYNEVIDV